MVATLSRSRSLQAKVSTAESNTNLYEECFQIFSQCQNTYDTLSSLRTLFRVPLKLVALIFGDFANGSSNEVKTTSGSAQHVPSETDVDTSFHPSDKITLGKLFLKAV